MLFSHESLRSSCPSEVTDKSGFLLRKTLRVGTAKLQDSQLRSTYAPRGLNGVEIRYMGDFVLKRIPDHGNAGGIVVFAL